jgi:hypothetical protein
LKDALLMAFKAMQRIRQIPNVPKIDTVVETSRGEKIFTERIEGQTVDFFAFMSISDLMDRCVIVTRVPE